MKNVISFIVLVLLLAGGSGCRNSSTVDELDEAEKEKLQRESLLSSLWLRDAADRAVRNILNDANFRSYVESHKVNGKMPLMKVGRLRNDTGNPDLDVKTTVDRIADALFKAGLVRVASGEKDVARSVVAMRELENDPAYAGVKRTPMEAPQLMLTCRISQKADNKAGTEMKESAELRVEIAELKSGIIVECTTVSWAVKKKRGLLAL